MSVPSEPGWYVFNHKDGDLGDWECIWVAFPEKRPEGIALRAGDSRAHDLAKWSTFGRWGQRIPDPPTLAQMWALWRAQEVRA